MSALARIGLSTLPYLVAIALSWRWVTDGMAQGAPYLLAGWWASLIGLFVVTMASLGPLAGGLVSMFLAEGLRLRPPAAVDIRADRWLSFAGPALYFLLPWLAWEVLWWWQPPVPTREATYGPAYFWVLGVLAATFAVPLGAFAAHLVIREARVGETD